MKDKSKYSKKFKNPLTTFGAILQNAISKPDIENNAIDKSQTQKKSANDAQKSPVILPSTADAPQKNSPHPKQNLTFKLGDVRSTTVEKKPKLLVKLPLPNLTSASASLSSPPPLSQPKTVFEARPISVSPPVLPESQVEKAEKAAGFPPKAKPIGEQQISPPDRAQKYTKIMREKFWENLDGETPQGQRGRAVRINLGIDLGTSFSKVVYRLGSESFPIQFGASKNKIDDYLVPSVVAIGGKAIKCQFEVEDQTKLSQAALIPNFKICLTCERGAGETVCSITKCNLSNLRPNYLPDDVKGEEASFLAAFYLAKLIGRAKSAVRVGLPEREIPSDTTIKWSANMAVPDKYLDSKVIEGFREAIETGWLMAEFFLAHPNFSNKEEAIICYQAAKKLHMEIKAELLSKNQDFDCFTYSEIGAEVASVTLSPTSEEGLYVLVDVGAGTVDTSVFRFRRENGEVIQETYAADIFKLGAAHIDARANASFKRKSLNWLRQIKENLLRLDPSEALIHITDQIKTAESDVTSELKEKLITVFRAAFAKHKNANIWSKLKLVMGGGGSTIEAYGQIAREAFSLKNREAQLIEISSLKIPRDFQMGTIPSEFFHRFAVAYGLSRDLIDLPELVPASEIEEMAVLRQRVYIDPTNDG